MEWTINGKHNDVDRNLELIEDGVQFTKTPRSESGEINTTVTFPNTLSFNSTRVVCVSINASGTLNSSEAVMIIAGMWPTELEDHDHCECLSLRSPTASCPSAAGAECHSTGGVLAGAFHMEPLPHTQL